MGVASPSYKGTWGYLKSRLDAKRQLPFSPQQTEAGVGKLAQQQHSRGRSVQGPWSVVLGIVIAKPIGAHSCFFPYIHLTLWSPPLPVQYIHMFFSEPAPASAVYSIRLGRLTI